MNPLLTPITIRFEELKKVIHSDEMDKLMILLVSKGEVKSANLLQRLQIITSDTPQPANADEVVETKLSIQDIDKLVLANCKTAKPTGWKHNCISDIVSVNFNFNDLLYPTILPEPKEETNPLTTIINLLTKILKQLEGK